MSDHVFVLFKFLPFTQAHSQCSETFYKKEIEAGIHLESSTNAVKRVQMLEMLKKFEEESASMDDEASGDEQDDSSDLANRLNSMDLGEWALFKSTYCDEATLPHQSLRHLTLCGRYSPKRSARNS